MQGSTVTANNVWSPVYVDALVLVKQIPSCGPTQMLYVQQDANWNVTAVVNAAGVQQRFVYTPFGVQTVLQANFTASGSSAVIAYAGQGLRLDSVIGDYENRGRVKDPVLQRFLQGDPAKADISTYRVEGDNPTDSMDPSGMADWLSNIWNNGAVPSAQGAASRIWDLGEGASGIKLYKNVKSLYYTGTTPEIEYAKQAWNDPVEALTQFDEKLMAGNLLMTAPWLYPKYVRGVVAPANEGEARFARYISRGQGEQGVDVTVGVVIGVAIPAPTPAVGGTGMALESSGMLATTAPREVEFDWFTSRTRQAKPEWRQALMPGNSLGATESSRFQRP